MSRYLGVANQTTTSPRLLQELRGLGRREADAQFVLVVPATPVRDLSFRRATDEKAEAVARKQRRPGARVPREGRRRGGSPLTTRASAIG